MNHAAFRGFWDVVEQSHPDSPLVPHRMLPDGTPAVISRPPITSRPPIGGDIPPTASWPPIGRWASGAVVLTPIGIDIIAIIALFDTVLNDAIAAGGHCAVIMTRIRIDIVAIVACFDTV